MKISKRKISKGFSLIEVVISISIIALILATLGMSFLASERLKLNAQVRSEIQRVGETILDYLSTLPPTDSYIYNIGNNQNNRNIVSLNDLVNDDPNDDGVIRDGVNEILRSYAKSAGIDVISQTGDPIRSKKGAIIEFNQQNNEASKIRVNFNAQFIIITLEIYYVGVTRANRRVRIIEVSRVVVL